VPERIVTPLAEKRPVPEALVYWMLRPARLTGAAPLLKTSTKSFLRVAPVLPPPP